MNKIKCKKFDDSFIKTHSNIINQLRDVQSRQISHNQFQVNSTASKLASFYNSNANNIDYDEAYAE